MPYFKISFLSLFSLFYAQGVMVVFSPCSLGLIPFVFRQAISYRMHLGIAYAFGNGLSICIQILSPFFISHMLGIGSKTSYVTFITLGLAMCIPKTQTYILNFFANLSYLINIHKIQDTLSASSSLLLSIFNHFIIGLITGLLWLPCLSFPLSTSIFLVSEIQTKSVLYCYMGLFFGIVSAFSLSIYAIRKSIYHNFPNFDFSKYYLFILGISLIIYGSYGVVDLNL